MRRPVLLGIMICALVVVAQAPAPSPRASASPASVRRVEYRYPVPSCAEGIKQMGLEGQPVSCEEPPPPTYDPPQMHGKFRLVPESYVGPLTYEDVPDTAPPGVVSNELQAIKMSSMYAEPAWLPEGYSLSSVSTGGADSEHMIVSVYRGPGEPIQVSRARQFSWPISLIVPVRDSAAVFETPVLGGKEAVLYYPKQGFSGQTVLSFVDGDIETTVFGDSLDPDTASRIALSLICGTSCLDSVPAATEMHPAATSGGSAQPESGTGVGGAAPGDVSTTSGTMYNNQIRVFAGLGTPDHYVKVLDLGWHGSGYNEAALDLQDPAGPGPTKGEDVWVTTWPWSGAGKIEFIAQEYKLGSNPCTGRYVELDDTGGHYRGKLTYVHLDPDNEIGTGQYWYSNNNNYWTIHWVGKVAQTQDDDYWIPATAAHLHQGQVINDGSQGGHVTHNEALYAGEVFLETDDVNRPGPNWMFSVPFAGSGDWDGDGCTDSKEATMAGFNPYNYWDFYDVPVPAYADPTPSGGKDRAVTMSDVLAVLLYVGASNNGCPNPNGVDYDSLKDGDWNGDTVINDYDKVGLRYDRSPSPLPDPPVDAGPPDGAVTMGDVLAALAQIGMSCQGTSGVGAGESGGSSSGGGGMLLSAANAMAVDAVSGGGINQSRLVIGTNPFDIDVVVTTAGAPYAGYNLSLSYDDQILQFVPTVDLDGDTTLDSWTYTGLGGMSINAKVSLSDADGDSVVDNAVGGSARSSGTTSATGAVITGRFRCIGNGTSALHLVTPSASPAGATTLGVGGATIDTSLADASVLCWAHQ